ncbi:4Fe-4S dicluster domain-containing protein [Musicola paradisiaca]|uniref:4Fe-4S ferredoxin iron-sulfur binding domain protein n=1 Tax=Musicola paradisiaca (strain Ech703) TaxID=579405 RepID=C6CDQ3_MUSP7|nr:4Fe-4S dicluster domain-containing protein [Musicola paradisiaca]ACS85170.1 4Fe-4S ferredoxin iron-sulfur binding domain protein [Musicola paradisiaca Ech703]
MRYTRRELLRNLGSCTVLLVGGAPLQLILARENVATGVRYAMLHDESRCIGCQACVAACKKTNQVPDGVSRLQVLPNPTKVEAAPAGTPPVRQFFRRSCQHCDNPPCVSACPTGASYKDPATGIVDVHHDRCVGCRYCLAACPYHVRFIHPESRTADKCNFCRDTQLAKGYLPACVQICPMKALTFGDINDPNSDISQAIRSKLVYRTKRYLGTGPNLYRVAGKQGEIQINRT